nr:hypothetical protein [Novosphingobium sp. AP12]
MNSIGGEVELAALPGGRPEYRPASSAQACMIIRHDEFDASHAARDQVIEEAAPVDLGLRQGDAKPSTLRTREAYFGRLLPKLFGGSPTIFHSG